MDAATDKYDDLSDLNTTEMNSIKEWEEQFKGEQIDASRTAATTILSIARN